MFGLLSSNRSIIGIDIGSSSLKLAEIDATSGGLKLVRCESVPLERGLIEKGVMTDVAVVAKAVKNLIKQSGSSAKQAAVALSGFSVLINKVSIRDMEEDEIRQLIIDEAGEYMPIDRVENVYFDIHVLGSNENNAENIDVIIAAAKKDIIADYRSVVESAGVRLVLMDVDSFALETVYEENYEFTDDDVVGLIHMGASITNLNIVKGGQSVFTRNILMGGNLVTEAIQAERDLSFDEAEKLKIQASDPGDDFGTGKSLLGLAEPIIGELERSIDFFISSVGMVFIRKVLLSGGSSRIPGIVEELSQRLRCDVEHFNPFQKLEYDKTFHSPEQIDEMASTAPIALGLALRKIEDL